MDAEPRDLLDRAIWRTRLIETLTAPALPVWCAPSEEPVDAPPSGSTGAGAPLARRRRRRRDPWGH